MDYWVLHSNRRDLLSFWERIAKKYIIGIMKSCPSETTKLVYYQNGLPKAVFSGEWTEKEVLEFCLGQTQEKRESSFEDYLYRFSDDA